MNMAPGPEASITTTTLSKGERVVPAPPNLDKRNYVELIGNTPLVDLTPLDPSLEQKGIKILGKCEFLNPSGSIKDRIAAHIVSDAEERGLINKDTTVVAASSGNTGAAIAMMCAMKGLKCIITTSGKTSQEKVDAIKAYGAEVIICPGAPADDPRHYVNKGAQIAKDMDNAFDVDQYNSQLNPDAYYFSMGPEIWNQTKGTVTHFVAGGSTGGTVSGNSRYLKERSHGRVKTYMSDPIGSVFFEYYYDEEKRVPEVKPFKVEGIGKDSIPGAWNEKLVDEIIQVNDQQSFDCCRKMSKQMGLLCGGSSGTNVAGALKLASTLEGPATIVTVLCDHGLKYLSKIYSDKWMVDNGFTV